MFARFRKWAKLRATVKESPIGMSASRSARLPRPGSCSAPRARLAASRTCSTRLKIDSPSCSRSTRPSSSPSSRTSSRKDWWGSAGIGSSYQAQYSGAIDANVRDNIAARRIPQAPVCCLEAPLQQLQKENSMHRTLESVLVLGLLLAPASLSSAQNFGQITGIVSDTTGGVLPGASVTVTSTQTAANTVQQANNAGVYVFPNLLPGIYNVRV